MPAWLHIDGAGAGTGVVNYIVDANPTINARTAAIVVQNSVFTVNQDPVICTYTLAASSTNLPARGGTGTVLVNVATPCPWMAISNVGWLQTIGAGTVTGTGTGTVQFTAAANLTTNARTGTITVQGQNFTVNQLPELSPVISAGPVITNALLNIPGLAVVSANPNLAFQVTAVDRDGDPLTYQWEFGDGTGSTDLMPVHTYATDACGVYTASVVVADGIMPSPTGTLRVAVACQLDITKLQLKPNFAKRNADSCSVTAAFVPHPTFSVTGQPVAVDIGGAVVNFILNKTGHGTGTNGTCTVSFVKRKGWSLTAALTAGDWHGGWTNSGVVNATIKRGVPVQVPVVLVIGPDAYAAEMPLTYTATTNKFGTAK